MNKAAFYLLFTVLFFGVARTEAAYVIKLKNGNEYITNRYWYDGGRLLFDAYDGVFGIERNFVVDIQKREQIVRPITVSDREPDRSTKSQIEAVNQTDIHQNKGSEETAATNSKDMNDPIVREFNQLKEKTQQVDGMLTAEIRELLNQITAFKNKLSKDSKLFVRYGREFNAAHELGSIVETALASRTQ